MLIVIALVPRTRSIDDGAVPECESHLRQIGLGIFLYCPDHGGNYPDSFQTLMPAEQMMPDIFVCPASNDNPSNAPTTQAQAAELSMPVHSSYLYLGKGLTEKTALPKQVIAYELPGNHPTGIHVLLGDGTVQFLDLKDAARLISNAGSGTHPVMLPP